MRRWEEVYIGEFTGPLDLLVTMVRDKKIDIMEINLLDLANQYLNYINLQQSLDYDIASEYLVMAGTLIEMKSRLLLPKDEEEIEDEYSYDDFLNQLTQYEQIKSVTEYFSSRQEDFYKSFSKPKSNTKFGIKIAKENDELLVDPLDIDMDTFSEIFKKVMINSEIRSSDQEIFDDFDDYNTITTTAISPKEIATIIVDKMKTKMSDTWTLEEVLEDEQISIKNLISSFLAILDLVRHQILKVSQINDTLEIQFTENVISDPSLIEKIEVEGYE
ncbi:segregation and condensation protein A [Mesoplasma photuris]|uniref:segregation and condensation protein A n=1 Tax=Mesoplasma photuris TaxID=217731 RepID=UPI0004E10E13|nr:segregation/condensation protein A [Mesoplasma photuris]